MKEEYHKRRLKECINNIFDIVENKKIEENQIVLGFLISVASVDLLELYLHRKNLLLPEILLKHTDFKSERKASKVIPFNFKIKEKVIKIMVEIEKLREKLCYGKPAKKEDVERLVNLFFNLLKIFRNEGVVV